MLDAGRQLIAEKGDEFTIQELVTEAGVALQTFYRYFTSKDELLVAVIGDAMTDACEAWVNGAADFPDPISRLRSFVTGVLDLLNSDGGGTARVVIMTRWRLHREFPAELAEAERPFVEMLSNEVKAAVEAGVLNPPDAEWDSWAIAELVRAVFHFYAFASPQPADIDDIKEKLWRFCLAALGGEIPQR